MPLQHAITSQHRQKATTITTNAHNACVARAYLRSHYDKLKLFSNKSTYTYMHKQRKEFFRRDMLKRSFLKMKSGHYLGMTLQPTSA